MKTRAPGCLLFVAVILWSGGCSTPQSRIDADPQIYAAAPPDVQKKIVAGEVEVGFSVAQARLALGKPASVSTRTTENGTQEVWNYPSKRPRFGIGFGVGAGGGGTHVGTGVGISTGGDPYDEPALRVIVDDGRVTAIERNRKR